MSDTALSPCLTPREVAARWRCRVATVRLMVRRGALAAIQLGRDIRILPEAVREAERGPLAVRPRVRRTREKIDPEIAALLGGD